MGLFPPPSLPERHPDARQGDILEFAPLLESCLTQTLIKALGQVKAGVNDSGRPCRSWGFAGLLEVRGRVRVRLTMKPLPVGFLALTEGILSVLGRIRIEVPQAEHLSTTTLRRYDAHLYFG
jgi:hypothetical protein